MMTLIKFSVLSSDFPIDFNGENIINTDHLNLSKNFFFCKFFHLIS